MAEVKQYLCLARFDQRVVCQGTIAHIYATMLRHRMTRKDVAILRIRG